MYHRVLFNVKHIHKQSYSTHLTILILYKRYAAISQFRDQIRNKKCWYSANCYQLVKLNLFNVSHNKAFRLCAVHQA